MATPQEDEPLPWVPQGPTHDPLAAQPPSQSFVGLLPGNEIGIGACMGEGDSSDILTWPPLDLDNLGNETTRIASSQIGYVHDYDSNSNIIAGVGMIDPAVDPVLDLFHTAANPTFNSDVGAEVTGVTWWVTPNVPCAQCASGGFPCKKVPEGLWAGQCATCVALGWACSFAGEHSPSYPESAAPTSSLAQAQSVWDVAAWGDMEGLGVADSENAAVALQPLPQPQASFSDSLVVEEADLEFLRSLSAGGPHLGEQELAVEGDSSLLADMAEGSRMETDAGAAAEEADAEVKDKPGAKSGARFSRESVRILRTWLTTHSRHPYPTDFEKDALMRQTGLNKQQITNWLANARRRGKVQPPRTTSPVYTSTATFSTLGMNVPARRGTPALESMNPLQRWAHSPPENEPASVTDIARAVTASMAQGLAGHNSPYLSSSHADDGSGRSLFNGSSASSAGTGTSRSSGSSYSLASRSSFRSTLSQLSHGSSRDQHRRRRRKNACRRSGDGEGVRGGEGGGVGAGGVGVGLTVPLRTFQCTFCPDTFRTKHDWQRHEKSLHLSLERWVCALHGPRCVAPETGAQACVFCGEETPDDAHVEAHDYAACVEKNVSERTFFRKDHLSQHLRLVHNVKYIDWAMKGWKMAMLEIVSRCGFCSVRLDTWTARADHLAGHFKSGKTMEHWKGDWGFEPVVLGMVENAIPPCKSCHTSHCTPYTPDCLLIALLIDCFLTFHPQTASTTSACRHTPLPPANPPPESPRSAYDLIKLEMDFFRSNHQEQHGKPPSDDEMQIEACRIIFASEVLSVRGIASELSWFRDVIMGNARLAQEARFGPLRSAAESRLSTLKINGKDNLFERCMLEQQLLDWVRKKTMLGLTAMDNELQHEACAIVGRIEEMSSAPSEAFANWIVRLVLGSKQWLRYFRQRAHLPRSEDLRDEFLRSSDPNTVDSTVHNYSRLERELGDYLAAQRRQGVEPSDKDLQRQACIIIYEYADEWNQTAADNAEWLAGFRARHHPAPATTPLVASSSPAANDINDTPGATAPAGSRGGGGGLVTPSSSNNHSSSPDGPPAPATDPFPRVPTSLRAPYLNNGVCDRVLRQDLRRWVLTTMSPNNPTSHVPSDPELQYQARWILYDSDDEWNQTPADNAEWLRMFKIDVGLLPRPTDDGAALTVTAAAAAAGRGGSGTVKGSSLSPTTTAVVADLGMGAHGDMGLGMDLDLFGPLELDEGQDHCLL